MKKTILTFLVILLYIFLNKIFLFAYLPISPSDLIIWKIENINQFKNEVNWNWYEFNLKNYINYNIKDNLEDIWSYRNNVLNKNTSIFKNQLSNKTSLKKWDIVVLSRYSWWDWILKIWCKNNLMYIEWIKNKVLNTVFENWKNRLYIDEVDKYEHWTELLILKKFNKKVWWCSWLKTFFDKDRTFEDLEWNKLKYLSYYKNMIDYKFYYILILFSIILWFLIYNLWKK